MVLGVIHASTLKKEKRAGRNAGSADVLTSERLTWFSAYVVSKVITRDMERHKGYHR